MKRLYGGYTNSSDVVIFLWLVKQQLPPAAFIFCSLFAIKNPAWTYSYGHSCSWEIRLCVWALSINYGAL